MSSFSAINNTAVLGYNAVPNIRGLPSKQMQLVRNTLLPKLLAVGEKRYEIAAETMKESGASETKQLSGATCQLLIRGNTESNTLVRDATSQLLRGNTERILCKLISLV